MMTRSAGQLTATPRGGRMGGQTGRGGARTRESNRAEVIDELVKMMVKEVTKVQTRGREAIIGMIWDDFKALMREELCPNNEMKKLETKFWYHAMAGAGHAAYTNQFHELAWLVPHLVIPKNKRIERYIYGLAPHIRGMVATTEPTTIQSTVLKVRVLTKEETVESQVGMEMLGMMTIDLGLGERLPQP
ncbi:reverse transcriptase domain-containing protein [Tanacetum coccineum]